MALLNAIFDDLPLLTGCSHTCTDHCLAFLFAVFRALCPYMRNILSIPPLSVQGPAFSILLSILCVHPDAEAIWGLWQTGSGKTHTMLGDLAGLDHQPSDNRGITPRVFESLFSKIQAVHWSIPTFRVLGVWWYHLTYSFDEILFSRALTCLSWCRANSPLFWLLFAKLLGVNRKKEMKELD